MRRGVALLIVASFAAGCGGGDSKSGPASSPDALKPATSAAPTTSAGQTTTKPKPQTDSVTLSVPSGWSSPKPPVASHIWPRPVKVVASFPIQTLPANAACPYRILDSMPPDGIYVLVAEYTNPRPPGFPPGRKLGPRPDLTKLDIRPAEVECWEGLGGATEFTENGRSFRVQVLLGPKVTAAERRQALATLASVKFGSRRRRRVYSFLDTFGESVAEAEVVMRWTGTTSSGVLSNTRM